MVLRSLRAGVAVLVEINHRQHGILRNGDCCSGSHVGTPKNKVLWPMMLVNGDSMRSCKVLMSFGPGTSPMGWIDQWLNGGGGFEELLTVHRCETHQWYL